MKLTVKHKVYGAVLVVGVIGVTVDQVFILPEQAAADRISPELDAIVRPPAADAGPAGIPATPISTARAAIADRLEAVAAARDFDLDRVPNAFLPPKSWVVVETPDPWRAIRASAETFDLTHVLTAVMAADDGGYAIIDGRTLFIGQVLDGFELIAVSRRSAVLEADGMRVELMLPDQGNP